jgi:predicted nucleic acid-binding protein
VTVVDTGVLVALANSKDRHYGRCVRWLDDARSPLLVPQPVIAEAGYLICSTLAQTWKPPSSMASALLGRSHWHL